MDPSTVAVFQRLLGSPGAGLGALADVVGIGSLGALAYPSEHDGMVAAARALEAGQGGNSMPSGPRMPSSVSELVPPELRGRLPSVETIANLVLGAAPGSGDYMAARDALESSAASLSALGRGDYMGAGARGVDALAAGLGIMPFLPYLASIKGVGKPIRAYHGSPHDFDKFSMDKIGSGEGAQAYGHGLYFAENEAVAQSYRSVTPDLWPEWGNLTPPAAGSTAQRLARMFDNDGARFSKGSRSIEDVAERLGGVPSTGHGISQYTFKDGSRLIMTDTGWDVAAPRNPPRMYEVNIHADPQRMIDWDAPVGAQPKSVLEALDQTDWWRPPGRDSTGESIVNNLAGEFGDDVAAMMLRDAGIPGVRYFDGMSRAAGDGTRNYVVFDDKLIEILRKYGIMAPMAGAGVGSLYMGDEEGM